MASIIKHYGKWRATVSVAGRRKSKSFATKREADAWAAEMSVELRRTDADLPDKRFRDLMDRYARDVSSSKRGALHEQRMIVVIMRDTELAEVHVRDLAPRHFADWRDRRLKQVSGSTVCREMNILSHACTVARREWGWLRENPCSAVSRPKESPPRTRRPASDEVERILFALGHQDEGEPKTVQERVALAWLFAMETAMRAGEICSLTWEHVFDRHVHLPTTKNGHARDVPLSSAARGILKRLRSQDLEPVFGLTTRRLDALFRKAKGRAGVEGLTFHDSRREALTRLSKRFGVLELARISGHRDLRVLQQVYYAPSVEDLADKLD